MDDKNGKIADSIRKTRDKRKSQDCKVYRFKIDRSSLSTQQLDTIQMMFLEAKRFYNHILTVEDIFHCDYKDFSSVVYLDRDRCPVTYQIQHLSATTRQAIISQVQSQIKGLSVLKKHGHQVGSLKFKSELSSIPLKQYGITHRIVGTNKFKIQGISKPIRVNGLKQLSKSGTIDYANAKLLYDGYDYFVSLTCFVEKEEPIEKQHIGIDLGCATTVTLSDGVKFDVQVGESERLKKLQTRLSRQVKRSNNWKKTRSKIRKEYTHLCNQKKDRANKILSYLKRYAVVMQDEQLDSWKTDINSKKIQHSALGRIKTVLMSRPDTVVLDQWFPTTKMCSKCGSKNQSITLSDRTFKCPDCGVVEDRDVHAAQNMLFFYSRHKDGLGTSHTSKPANHRKIRYPMGSC